MFDATSSLGATLVRARAKARAVDPAAFDRRFGAGFDAEGTARWNEFEHASVEHRVDEVVAWAVAEVRSSVAAADQAERERVEREVADGVARTAQREEAERAAWSQPWMKTDDRFRISASNHAIAAVYHWTPVRCLGSILALGIRSRSYLDRYDIAYEPHSYGTWGKAAAFEHHVAVSLRPQRGMFWQVEDASLLVVDRRLLARNGSFYAPGNTASRTYDFATVSRRTSVEDLEALFAGPHDEAPADWQAEIWIPKGVHQRRIERIIVRDERAADAARRAVAGGSNLETPPAIEINGDLSEWTLSSLADDLVRD